MADFIETEQAVSEAEIRKVEQELGISFPEQFVEHYLLHNGGSPNPYCFVMDDTVLMVQEFLALRYGDNTLEYTYETLHNNAYPILKNLVPFASDPGGNYFCFSETDDGSIYYYDGEQFDNPERAFTRISNSLYSFLNGLEDEPVDI